ncbi:hypothetical protein M422DRAFT_229263 [Sphaerobolus stellatus SS14]|uniref:Transmembrane protein 53 n=1 Tax=Sphaerobolus stellatus (strain SS14) TaxID=990650 RepID=A0A0C9TIQ6_SPHS4|nr:hypothetical protein M422DRAFT_235220 [Sphaerobolus stellatus SS14]KIJ42388.1 hypothetical protein M422DRAFT_229263 [Sphaerobolus stellatus SS14]
MPPQLALNPIANDIYLSIPNGEEMDKVNDSDPRTVVIFGWMGAQLKHLQKYATLYHELYPSTPVLLVCSHPRLWFQTKTIRLANFTPALAYLPISKVIYHAFSNGGCFRLADFLSLRPISTQSYSTIVFDSCPGVYEIKATTLAFLAPFKSKILRFLARILIMSCFSLMSLWNRLLRKTDIQQTAVRIPLNNGHLVRKDMPRAYIYSKSDKLVQSWAVEAHADEAEKKGYMTTRHVYLNSDHVAHFRTDPERYKRIIRDSWQIVVSGPEA